MMNHFSFALLVELLAEAFKGVFSPMRKILGRFIQVCSGRWIQAALIGLIIAYVVSCSVVAGWLYPQGSVIALSEGTSTLPPTPTVTPEPPFGPSPLPVPEPKPEPPPEPEPRPPPEPESPEPEPLPEPEPPKPEPPPEPEPPKPEPPPEPEPPKPEPPPEPEPEPPTPEPKATVVSDDECPSNGLAITWPARDTVLSVHEDFSSSLSIRGAIIGNTDREFRWYEIQFAKGHKLSYNIDSEGTPVEPDEEKNRKHLETFVMGYLDNPRVLAQWDPSSIKESPKTVEPYTLWIKAGYPKVVDDVAHEDVTKCYVRIFIGP